MTSKISAASLQLGDILLYHGTSLLSRLIRLFDGGGYSHASIYDGAHIMEALENRITINSVQTSVAGAAYVDVFRFVGAGGQQLGSPAYPIATLQATIAAFESTPERYAYEEIVLLAVMASTRRIPLPAGSGIVVRNILDSAADAIAKLTAAGKQPVICSELVYRCYLNTGELIVRGGDVPAAVEFTASSAPMTPADKQDQDETSASARNFLAKYAMAKGCAVTVEMFTAAEPLTALAVADFVTPHDLEVSPSLTRVGTLDMSVGAPTVFVSQPLRLRHAAAEPPSPAAPLPPPSATQPPSRMYHPNLLIVKTRGIPADATPATAMSFVATDDGIRPGFAFLSHMDKANRIRRITPLARKYHRPLRSEVAVGMHAITTLMMASGPSESPDPNQGVSLIEVESEADALTLRGQLASDPNIAFVSRVPIRYAVTSSVTTSATTLWNLTKIRWYEAQGIAKSAEAVNIAVLDTGVDANHPDLLGRIANYIYQHPALANASSVQDIVGHGTHVSGIIAANLSQDGLQGICDGRLNVWKIFNDEPILIDSSSGPRYEYVVDPGMYARALADCLDADIGVMNLSIGGPGQPDPQEQELFERLITKGVAIIAAMGNERQLGSPIFYPAAIPGVIAVGATDMRDHVTNFSSAGPHICLSAPGQGILSTLPTYTAQSGFQAVAGPDGSWSRGAPDARATNYDSWRGTSMAAPHITGSVAVLIATRGRMSPGDIRSRLSLSCNKVADMSGHNFSNDYGSGRLDLYNLLS